MEETESSTTKTIIIMESVKKTKHTKEDTPSKPEKSKRVITTTKTWNFNTCELSHEYQKEVITKIMDEVIISTSEQDERLKHIIKFIMGEIQKKIYGYKCQDLKKQMFSSSEFINMENIIKKLIDCNLQCYYCKEPIYILYEYVREPHQWTLERINNAEGHNVLNTEIACLSCNLSRRCMFHERYLLTKQISNIVKK